MNQIASHFRRLGEAAPQSDRIPLGQILLDNGDLTVGQLLPSLSEHKALGVPLGQIAVTNGLVSETSLFDNLAVQWGLERCHFKDVVAQSLAQQIGIAFCLRHKAMPVKIQDGVLLLAVSGMASFSTAERELEDIFGLVTPVISSPTEIEHAMALSFPQEFAEIAATELPIDRSCRGLADRTTRRIVWGATVLFTVVLFAIFFPTQLILTLTCMAILLSISSATLKVSALTANILSKRPSDSAFPLPERLPKVSVLVPLHREPDVAKALVGRLSRLTYPKPLLEVLLVIEENDDVTWTALKTADLPPWMRPVSVPEGNPKTKPRALNHAYHFCTGEIIGIYDAEDAPDPDQIEKVVARFNASADDVACLQGILQFYNPTQNWLARCFTMDYAAWFRVVLPGLSTLGMPVPLGGTTLFLKRHAIEAMQGWDAHNVTEDADLGIRLNRAGYRTELFDSVTGEEANCYPWKWIRQRSRWIKGYMVTYWAHMRRPVALWRDLGPKAFIGFQVLFLGTNLHFLTAPILWSFWLSYLGVSHAFFTQTPQILATAAATMFLTVEFLGMVIFTIANARAKRSYLTPWIPTMSFYYLLAIPAGLKALWEFFKAPVYWDKTDHGHSLDQP